MSVRCRNWDGRSAIARSLTRPAVRLLPTLAVIAGLGFHADARAGQLLDRIRAYDLNDYSLGLAGSVAENPYRGADSSAIVYPYLTSFRHSAFTKDWLLIRGENLGIRFVSDSGWEAGLVGRVQTLGLGNADLPGLADRSWSVEAGPLIGWRRWPIHAQFRTYREIPSRHSGDTSELELSLPVEFPRGFFVPAATIRYRSGGYTRYYFGVSPTEALADRPVYEPGATLDYLVGFALGYRLASNWLLKASMGLEILDPAVVDSPLVDKDRLWSVGLGLAYNADVFRPKDFAGSSRPGSFMLRAAAYSSRLSTEFRRDPANGGTGDRVDFEDFLGNSDTESVLQTEIIFRMGFYHRLRTSYFEIDRSLQATLSRDFAFGDEIFLEGTDVVSTLASRRLDLLYGFSLVRDAQKELGVQAGITYARFQLDVVAAETGQAERATVDAPLPTFGLFGSFALGEKWEVGADAGVFALDFDRYSGFQGHASLTLDRAIGDTLAAGIGYDYYLTRLESQDDDLRGLLRSHNHGPKIYFSWMF